MVVLGVDSGWMGRDSLKALSEGDWIERAAKDMEWPRTAGVLHPTLGYSMTADLCSSLLWKYRSLSQV